MSTPAETAAIAGFIASAPGIVRDICRFNQDPASYIDASRRGQFFAQPVADALWDHPRARRHLSRHILERIGARPCLDARRPEWMLALLEGARLDRLARHVTAALVGARVRRSLSRGEVIAWREWLMPEAHEFALTRAGLLPFNADAGADARSTPALRLGQAWIVAASRHWDESVAKRFLLKLPAGPFPEAEALDGAFASRLVSSVLFIVEPRWCSSFATIRN